MGDLRMVNVFSHLLDDVASWPRADWSFLRGAHAIDGCLAQFIDSNIAGMNERNAFDSMSWVSGMRLDVLGPDVALAQLNSEQNGRMLKHIVAQWREAEVDLRPKDPQLDWTRVLWAFGQAPGLVVMPERVDLALAFTWGLWVARDDPNFLARRLPGEPQGLSGWDQIELSISALGGGDPPSREHPEAWQRLVALLTSEPKDC